MGKILTIVLLVLLLAQPSFAGSYFVFEQWGGTWQDTKKSSPNHDDSLMCWAAAAANVLKWGHWDTGNCETAASIFGCIHDHWTNGTGSPAIAWQWWFDGRQPDREVSGGPAGHGKNIDAPCDSGKGVTQLKQTDEGGAYWSSFDFHRYLHQELNPARSMNAIDEFLHKGYGVVVGVEMAGRPIGHVVTAWGCRTDDKGAFQGIYVTNSDDGVDKLAYLSVTWDDVDKRWVLPALAGYIKEVWALEPRPAQSS
jgi:hypothetical protein